MDGSAEQDDRYDSRLSDQSAGCVPVQSRRHQVGLETIELDAGISQPGYLYLRGIADAQNAGGREAEQIDTSGQDVLADLPGAYDEALCLEFVQEFCVQYMDLPEVRLGWIAGDAGSVLYRRAGVRVALHTEPWQQGDPHFRALAEIMSAALTDGFDDS